MKIYLIEENSGEYEDRVTTIIHAFTDREEAKTYVCKYNKLSDKLNKYGISYDKSYYSVEEVELDDITAELPMIEHNITLYNKKYDDVRDLSYTSYIVTESNESIVPSKDYKTWELDYSEINFYSTTSKETALLRAEKWLLDNGYNIDDFVRDESFEEYDKFVEE